MYFGKPLAIAPWDFYGKNPTSVVVSSDLPKKKIPFLDELSMWEVTRPGKR